VALRVGSGALSWQEFGDALAHPGKDGPAQMIVWLHRFPRILAALLIGAGLAASGCVLQGLLRNPLAEPYTLGISGGAAFGAAVGMILIPAAFSIWTLPVTAFLGGLLAVGLVYLVARQQQFSIIGLVLAGVVLSFVFSAMVLLMITLANPLQVQSVMFWLMGTLSRDMSDMIRVLPFLVLPGMAVAFVFGRDLDAVSLGDEKAAHLGVDSGRMRQMLFVVTSLMVGACIAAAGMIGFVGLIMPHLMRLMIGPRHRPLILASALAGAAFLVICDTLARTVLSRYGQELPVGVVTGLVGGMFFIGLFLRKKGQLSSMNM
jgi:iron complex transport system permease protein